MKHYIYKTTNLITKKYYIGKHSSQNIENDTYLGSGLHLNNSIKKYGRDNFAREILYQFESENEAYEMESIIVNEEFVRREDTYNMQLGGFGATSGINFMVIVKTSEEKIEKILNTDERYVNKQVVGINKDKVTVIDELGSSKQVSVDDQNYKKGKYKQNLTGTSTAIDKQGNTFNAKIDDPRWKTGQITGVNSGKVFAYDVQGNIVKTCKNDPKLLSGQLKHNTKGKVVVKDKEGNRYQVDKNDPRYLSGQLVGITKGRILVKDKYGNRFYVDKDDPRWLSGELVGITKK